MKTWIVIAAFNEAKVIVKVLKELKSAGYNNIVVVDDGSSDSTTKNAKKVTSHVITHKVNQGQGAALRTGIKHALSKGADFIVTYDADGQHSYSDIPELLKPVKKGKADITIGSRFLTKKSNVPFSRKIVLKLGAFVVWLFYGIWLTDSHNGFRAMSRKAAKKIKITMNRMEHASEIISEIKKKKLRHMEVPVKIKYTKYSKRRGQSNLNAIKIFYKMLIHKLK